MKKNILLCLLLLFLSGATSLSAQNTKIDSLLTLLKTDKPDTNRVNDLNDLSWLYKFKNSDSAIVLIKEAIQISEKLNWLIGMGTSYHKLAAFYNDRSENDSAFFYYYKAINIWNSLEKNCSESELGRIKYKKSSTLGNIGLVHYALGDYLKAIDYFLNALKIAEEIGSKQRQAGNLNNLGVIYMFQNQYQQALELYSRSLKINEELGDRIEQAKILGNMGIIFKRKGDYSKALEYSLTSLRIDEELGAKLGIASNLGNIGNIYDKEGNHNKAREYYEKALTLAAELKNRQIESNNLGNAGLSYEEEGNFTSALNYYFKSLKVSEETGNKIGIGNAFANIANVYDIRGNRDTALSYYNKAIKLQEELGNREEVANVTANLGSLYTEIREYAKAEEYLSRALAFYDSLGILNDRMQAEKYFIQLYAAEGDFKKSFLYCSKLFRSTSSFLLANISLLTEDEKSGFVNYNANNSDLFFSGQYLAHANADSSSQWLYDYELFQRGLVLESSSGLAAAVQKDTSLKKIWEKYVILKNTLSKEYLAPVAERREDLKEIESQASSAENELLARSAQYSNWKQRVNATWHDVQKNLAKDEAAIEFVSFHLHPGLKDDSTLYEAMILTHEMKYPQTVFLFEEKQLSGLMQSTAMRGFKVADNSSNTLQFGDSLFKLILEPMMPYLKGIKSIAFAPDGLLHKINLAAVSGKDHKPLCQTYKLTQVFSTRSVVFPSPEPSRQPASFWGGIDYTYQLPNDTNHFKDSTLSSTLDLASRSRGDDFEFLEGAKGEVEALNNLFIEKKFSSKVIEGKNASEEKLKQQDGNSSSVLHFATHGFFFPPPDKKRNNHQDAATYSLADDPLMRSGIVFAGGNYAWTNGGNPYEKEDGILTAYEVSYLNLSSTNLVVLSACKTALGDIKGSEGVYGLQRAFKMAGVNFIMMSLWEIPDKETQEFMLTFYNAWLSGQSIRSAFQQTQIQMATKYDPYKWAAFVLVE